jgi:hypothetical protein
VWHCAHTQPKQDYIAAVNLVVCRVRGVFNLRFWQERATLVTPA